LFRAEDVEVFLVPGLAFDISGNVTSRKISVYTEGYEFPYNYVFSTFYNDSSDH